MDPPGPFRCDACGNLTRFDVVERLRRRTFFHYTLGGDASAEEHEVLEHEVERVQCRWCGSADQVSVRERQA